MPTKHHPSLSLQQGHFSPAMGPVLEPLELDELVAGTAGTTAAGAEGAGAGAGAWAGHRGRVLVKLVRLYPGWARSAAALQSEVLETWNLDSAGSLRMCGEGHVAISVLEGGL